MPVKVLVVDDAVVFRKGISDALAGDPDVQVMGTASNGKLALQKMAISLPDLVILDVEMPEMDGLATVAEIRKLWPRLPVIMCSAHTTEGARVTLQALERGANDFVTKPVTSSMQESLAHFRHELLPRIKGNCRHLLGNGDSGVRPAVKVPSGLTATTVKATAPTTPTPPPPRPRPTGDHHIDLVVIGVSTGGPNALAEVIPLLPGDLPVPVLIVQHMPAMFTKLLAERLGSKSALKVDEASAGIIAKPGQVWIAPGGHHLTVSRVGAEFRLALNDDPPENSCRPAADVLFRTAAQTCGATTLAVVLTGMGEDGLIGCRLIHQAGGQVIVQDKESSVVWGMPGAVAKSGLAEKQLPLKDVAGEIVSRLRVGRPAFHGVTRKV
jgi:two-component system, chemotaxis family, protein-glutamate methylesterase/glutaminase